ncbi:proteoglycan 4 isoform X3 [Eleutherodactylus coqui]|uniref:proteoglycan 4 isoform X3 n=1 Tax=Eleutherodactylus coqui TaxID=57060 RepID=UPI003462030A
MKIYSIPLVLCFIISISPVSSQSEGSCVGRCGQGYVRADPCHCDYNCMSFLECCQDYKKVCTTEGSCKGRCYEGFIRGQTCDCDPGCENIGRCCPDYEESCPKPTKKPEDKVPEDIPPEDPNNRRPPKNKKRLSKKQPKYPKKKKQTVESEEEIEESEENVSSSSFSSSSSSSSVKGSKTTKKLSRKNQKKNKDGKPDPDNPDKDPGEPNDKDKNPKKPKGTGDEPEDPDGRPKEPSPNDKDKNPKKPKGTGDEPEDPDGRPKDGNPKKPKGTEDDSEDPDKRPKGKKKPKDSSTLEVEENIEEHTDSNENNDENASQFNQRTTRKRSPLKKKPRKPGDDSEEDPSRKPSPSNRRKKKPNFKNPNKKRVKPTDEDDNEPTENGKGKNPKKKPKPNPKGILKTKKKVNSEEERQETIESEHSSSSQSSSSHSRSKSSTRRLKGKNKKNVTDKKKKFPEEPEDPLMPPKRKKEPFSTPVPTFNYEGSGDDGSGMDFLPTTTSPTTLMVNSTTTASQTTMKTNQTTETVKPSKSPTQKPNVTSDKMETSTPKVLPTTKGPEKTTSVMNASTQSPTPTDKTTGKSTSTEAPLQQMSTLKTPQDQSTTDASGITHTTVSGKLQETTNTLPDKTNTVDPSKQTLPITDNATTQNSEKAQTKETITNSDIMKTTESSTRHSDLTISSKIPTKEPTTEPHQTPTSDQSFKPTTEQPKDKSEVSTIMSTGKQRPTPTNSVVFETTKDIDDTEMSTKSMHPTKTPDPRDFPTKRPMEPEKMENIKTTKPPTTYRYHVCDLLKDEAIKLKISGDDLQHIIEICTEMQQYYPLVSTPSPDVKQPNTDDRDIPSGYSPVITPNWNPQPQKRIIQIVEEIYRRMIGFPTTNLTSVYSYTIHRPSVWLLLLNKIRSTHDPQMNLCIGKPADGMTTLQNGSMVTFRGHYYWMLNQGGVMGSPQRITDVWGIPSPIDTVFTRCNCGGKTFFIKGSRYWRFTNDVMDQGYPKEINKGFGGLSGKITAVLPVAGYRRRPESVYFFKPSGSVQKYTFRQEQTKRCTKKKRPSVQYPVYTRKIQTVKFRFPRDVVRHRIQIHRTYTSLQQPLGILHEQKTISTTWRGIPNNIISAVSLPNYEKKDGFDYYVFNKDKYYNINMSSKVAVKPPPGSEQKTTKDWYKCKE